MTRLRSLSQCLFAGLTVALFLFTSGCETVIDLDPPEESPRLALAGTVTSDTAFVVVRRSRSAFSPFGQEQSLVSGADVRVEHDGQTVTLREIDDPPVRPAEQFEGYYGANVTALGLTPGDAFTVTVAADALPTATVRTSIPALPTARIDRVRGSERGREVQFVIDDPAGPDHYVVQILETFVSAEATEQRVPARISTSNASIVQSQGGAAVNDTDYFGQDAYFDDTLFDGETERIALQYTPRGFDQGRVDLEVIAITRAHYDYLQSVDRYDVNNENPFAEPVRIRHTVENGYGSITGASVRTLQLNRPQ